jgi:SAM-dependent methyltransferase
MIGSRLKPSLFHEGYLTLTPLSQELERRLRSFDNATILDLGGGDSPYTQLLEGKHIRYLSTDIDPAYKASIICIDEAVCLASSSVDMVLCTQVLEHVDDPKKTVEEIYRILRPSGTVLLSTHGAYPWHPCPNDYWRWTHQGLRKVFENAGFTDIEVIMLGTSVTSRSQNSIVLLRSIPWPHWLRYKVLVPMNFLINCTGVIMDTIARRLPLGDEFYVSLAPGFLVSAKKK